MPGGPTPNDNISPLHLLNVKRLAFETDPINPPTGAARTPAGTRRSSSPAPRPSAPAGDGAGWIDAIEARLRARAGNPAEPAVPPRASTSPESPPAPAPTADVPRSADLPLPDPEIERLILKFRK